MNLQHTCIIRTKHDVCNTYYNQITKQSQKVYPPLIPAFNIGQNFQSTLF